MHASAPSRGSRRCLALYYPYLATQRVLGEWSRDLPSPDALALTARSGNAVRLVAVDPAAAALGLGPGLMLADARARVPTLITLPHEPDADARLLDGLARAMRRFTPMVALDPPDGLLLDIQGCTHLFGGEEGLTKQVLGMSPLTVRHALADNPHAARALVRHGRAGMAVHDLPIAALALEEDAAIALKRAGLKSLGDLARRPLSAIAARFGEAAVRQLRLILGDAASPITPLRPRSRIRHQIRFAEPVGRTDDLLAAIEELLHRARSQLEARHEGARRMDVMLCRSDGAERVLGVETSLPSRDPARFLRLLGERIDSLADPIDPGFGFDAVRLAMSGIEPLAAQQAPLAGKDKGEEQGVELLIDRLSTRLGPGRVQRIQPHDSHIPEMAQQLTPAMEKASGDWSCAQQQAPRPLLLIDPPQRIMVIAEVPDGSPQRFRWKGKLHDVRLSEGPERIASEWWQRKAGFLPGRGGLTRDYYRVEDQEGRRFWLFRHGLFEEKGTPDWYVHGLLP